MAFALKLSPYLSHAIDLEVLIEHTCDLGPQAGIALARAGNRDGSARLAA
jgi:Ran GTPase-activating protein (RanGAP) involved in mRNA processing and transport